MQKNERFLNTYGWVLVAFGCPVFVFVAGMLWHGPDFADYFGMVVTAWYFCAGMGVLFRRLWGYYLFKSFLYLLLLGFPIGTYISYQSLKFMRANSIKSEFRS